MAKQRTSTEPADSTKRPLTVQNVLFALRRWWLLAAPLGLVLAVAVAAPVYFLFEPAYQASAYLLIQDREQRILGGRGESPTTRFVATQIATIRSEKVLAPVLGLEAVAQLPDFRDEDDKLAALRKNLKVAAEGGSEIYAITFTASTPEGAQRVANAIKDQYLSIYTEQTDFEKDNLLKRLEEARIARKEEVDRHRKRVETLAKQANVVNPIAPPQEKDDDIESRAFTAVLEKLIQTEGDYVLAKIDLEAFKNATAGKSMDVPSEIVDRAVEQDPEVLRMTQAIAARRAKLDNIKAISALRTKDPRYVSENRLFERDQALLAQQIFEVRKPIEAELKEARRREHAARIEQMEIRITGLAAAKAELEKQLREERSRRVKLTGDTMDLEFAKDDLALHEDVQRQIAARHLLLTTERSAPQQVSEFLAATPPSQPVEDLPYKKLLLAAMFGFCLPFGLAVAWEYFHQRVADSAQLTASSNLMVVGEIASLPDNLEDVRSSRSRKAQDSLRLFEESIDNLRTCLVLSESLKDVRVLAVTSAVSGEGKTSVASQLAISLARATGKSTLLLDGDLRKPDVHNVFDLELSPGLAEVLDGSATFDEAVGRSGHEHVDVLTAGKRRKNPHELFGNGELKGTVAHARESYHFIVIDTPPVLSASEALVLSKIADVALICVRRGHSRIDQVRTVHDRLSRAGAHTAGATLIGVPLRDYAYRYGSYGYNQG